MTSHQGASRRQRDSSEAQLPCIREEMIGPTDTPNTTQMTELMSSTAKNETTWRMSACTAGKLKTDLETTDFAPGRPAFFTQALFRRKIF